MHRQTIHLQSRGHQQMIDVTDHLREIAKLHPDAALMALFTKGATSAVMLQENFDPNVPTDILNCLNKLVPHGQWKHDQVDHNGDAHIKAGIVGPSETIPLENGELVMGRWQNVFFCDFDGPRNDRQLVVTLLP